MNYKWLLCENCIAAIRSRGEKIFVGECISQDIDYDEIEDKWFQKYDEDKPILKCNWCDEIDDELYECL